MSGETILITGGNGFVGRHCANVLRTHGYNVRLAVRKNSIVDNMLRGFDVVEVDDLSSQTQWQQALKGCDCIIHTAGRAHLVKDKSINAFHEFHRVNVEGTISLATQAIQANVRRFIYLSSVKVNGEISNQPFAADDIPQPHDAYSQSKLAAEEVLKRLSQDSTMEVVIIRPPLIYGCGVKGNFKSLLNWVNKGFPVPMTMHENKRSFVGLDNLVDLIDVCVWHPKAKNEIFLVSDGQDMSTAQLLYCIYESMRRSKRLIRIPGLPFILNVLGKQAVTNRLYASLQVNIDKNKRLLDWQPKYDFKAMLDETVQDFLDVN